MLNDQVLHRSPFHRYDTWIILDSQIYVFLDAKSKVASVTEIALSQFILLHLQSTLQDFFSFSSSNGAMASNFFITLNTKRTHSVTGFRCNRLLPGELLEHLGGTGQSVSRFSNTNIQTKLQDAQLPHRVVLLILFFLG